MKKKLVKLLYSGILFTGIGSILISCASKPQMQTKTPPKEEVIENNKPPVQGNYLNLSNDLTQVFEKNFPIFDDLYSSGYFDKLILSPTQKDHSIDIQTNGFSKPIKEGEQEPDFLKGFFTDFLNVPSFVNSLSRVKIGEVNQSNQKNADKQFYAKDEFFVKDASGKWVKLDFEKQGQYLPTKLEDGKLLVEYKIKHEGSNELTNYYSSLNISGNSKDQVPLSNELIDSLEKFQKANASKIDNFRKTLENFSKKADSYTNLLSTIDPQSKTLLNDLKDKITDLSDTILAFVEEIKQKSSTNFTLIQYYFQIKDGISDIYNKIIDLVSIVVEKNRNLSKEQAQNLINSLKEIFTKVQGKKLSYPFKAIEYFLNLNENAIQNDRLLFNINDLNNYQQVILKLFEINQNKLIDLKLKPSDIVLLLAQIFSLNQA
ncbi:Uncharacterised protein [Mycoplasmopsis citelli]|uniref:Lipoprotein n=1 Tax=Mycoplasmopsis citelli TaxID=171281 RepID=A0A449B313_9BACT|nr:hypothetical protein [Mycoplasmopsis citelli]VEU74973.1 Uncharacterised protein [Mycoplasmopsis citelli]